MKTILSKALAGSCIAGLVILAGCSQSPRSEQSYSALSEAQLPPLPSSMPLEPGPATPLIAAPDVGALPRAPRPALGHLANDYDDYAYLDRAAYYDDAYFDAPPDYAFDYDDVSPWGWEGYDGSTVYLEPVDDGYRYYYYEPGYDTPYLVRDNYYSYAYDGPSLVVIYDNYGRPLPRDRYGERWDYAGRYFVRGRELRAAARDDRRGVIGANWAAQRRQIERSNAIWESRRRNNPAWSNYHDRTRDQQGSHWRQERAARTVMARQFDDFQRRGFRQEPSLARSDRRGRSQFAEASQQRNLDRREMHGGQRFQQDRQSDPHRFQQQEDSRRSAFFAARQADEHGRGGRQMASPRDQREQQSFAQRQQRGQRGQEMLAQREQQRTERGQQMLAKRDQQRAQRQQQMGAQRQQQLVVQRDQQRAERQRQMGAEREQQRSQRQQQMVAQREQQRAGRQQQVGAQREQQRAQRQQEMSAQREQQRAQRQQQMSAQREQQHAQRQQQAMAQREQQHAQRQQAAAPQQARNDRGGGGGGGGGKHGRD
ncbi:hypothetical protein KRR38_04855 [Novosphingobium sp. G106]|uniref:hypothetical protein n=1 Tax=Novosphingobium sp. G106 TaxID=2849500 RepID=UPI001C2D87E4|nr:hypothetical protein [Novosphingobium sp. G106]MBV1687021.1 hypothetical protein [Novosphingobium sp. G106]